MVGSKIRHIWVSPIIHVRNAKYVKKEVEKGEEQDVYVPFLL